MRIITAVILIFLIALTTGIQANPMWRKKHFKKTLIVQWCIAGLAIVVSITAIYGSGIVSLSRWLNKLSLI